MGGLAPPRSKGRHVGMGDRRQILVGAWSALRTRSLGEEAHRAATASLTQKVDTQVWGKKDFFIHEFIIWDVLKRVEESYVHESVLLQK